MWLSTFPPPSTALWVAGMAMWLTGAAVNLRADYHLLQLRRAHGAGVHLPTDALFEHVSAANYSGEILEWVGYALACQHLAAAAFAAFTFFYLAPRAVQHHADYKARFGAAVPPGRKALIPFLL